MQGVVMMILLKAFALGIKICDYGPAQSNIYPGSGLSSAFRDCGETLS